MLDDARQAGNKAQEANVLNRTSNLLREEGKFEQAMPLLQQALSITQALDLNDLTFNIYKSLHHCYLQTNQLQKAYEYNLRAGEMDDYLLNEQRMNAFDELEVKYQTAEKEKQLVLAENESLLKSRELLKSRWAIALLVIALLIAALLTRHFQQKKKFAQLIAIHNQVRHEQELKQLQQEQESAAVKSLFIGQEQERRRIANELHDSLGGLLYSMQLQLSKTPNSVAALRPILENAIAENRRISQNLLPATLARLGLLPALREWAEQFEKTYTLPVHLDLPENDLPLPDEIATSLFRIAQELMNNAAKHAGASRIALHLHPGDETLSLLVEDNGAGFDPGQQTAGFLKTVNSRTQLLKGKLHVDSQPERGTTVIVEIPFPVG
ncbi:MAG: sensor histidine kinase [Saprospiraceae bacterium]|nr:sensor histidine kinase [Saprospiraceae bacterium]MCF8249040.1 sensor histidine kinase [Saprospiraceae bacterium]MCF8282665.1 sensor histidine kinase [Bacteroidales bacterium]MCF8311062.1 sensor histidine kinase [Saprospiraceae bacterium]